MGRELRPPKIGFADGGRNSRPIFSETRVSLRSLWLRDVIIVISRGFIASVLVNLVCFYVDFIVNETFEAPSFLDRHCSSFHFLFVFPPSSYVDNIL